MIDSNNPLQVTFLEKVNSEIGNLTTSLLSVQIEKDYLRQNLEAQIKENDELRKIIADMGLANANIRNDLEAARKRKK